MNGEDLVAGFSGAWIALHWIPVEATFHVLSSPLLHYKDQIIFNSFLSSLRKNGKQYGSFLRDLDSNPSSASWSLPQAWLLHCKFSFSFCFGNRVLNCFVHSGFVWCCR